MNTKKQNFDILNYNLKVHIEIIEKKLVFIYFLTGKIIDLKYLPNNSN